MGPVVLQISSRRLFCQYGAEKFFYGVPTAVMISTFSLQRSTAKSEAELQRRLWVLAKDSVSNVDGANEEVLSKEGSFGARSLREVDWISCSKLLNNSVLCCAWL